MRLAVLVASASLLRPDWEETHSSIRGLVCGWSLLALLGTSFCLQGAGAALHTLGEAEVAVVGAVVQVSQPCQGQDVVTGDPQDGQFGQLLPIGVAWHLLPERLEGCADGVHPRPLPGVGQEPPGLLQGFDLRGGGGRFAWPFQYSGFPSASLRSWTETS